MKLCRLYIRPTIGVFNVNFFRIKDDVLNSVGIVLFHSLGISHRFHVYNDIGLQCLEIGRI